MKKIFFVFSIFLFSFFVCTFNVYANENYDFENVNTLENYESNALAASEVEEGSNSVSFNKISDSFFYSPVQNYFFEGSGTKLSYSGSNHMLYFKSLLGDSCFYTSGNLIYKNYNSSYNYYPVHEKQYFIDNDGILFIEHGVLNLGYNPNCLVANCILSEDVISGKQAAVYCLNNSEKMTDENFLMEHNLKSSYVYSGWSEDGKFNPWVDGSQNRSSLDTNFEPDCISIPANSSGCYFDYLYSDSDKYNHIEMRRCYYNGLFGDYSLDYIEKLLPGYNSQYDSILIIGVGSYFLEDSSNLKTGLMESPNLLDKNIIGWSYTIVSWKHYNTTTSFVNSTCSEEFDKKYHINVDTTGGDIGDFIEDKEPNIGIFEKIFKNLGIDGFGEVFKFFDNYIKSMADNINRFGDMVKIVFGWLPEPVSNLLNFALIAFVGILLIKLLLHLF